MPRRGRHARRRARRRGRRARRAGDGAGRCSKRRSTTRRRSLCAEAVGALRYANAATLEYLKTRKQFGAPIGAFQALQHRMVDMTVMLEQARSMAALACTTVDRERDPRRRRHVVSAAKMRIADACRHVSQEAVQLHGGMGMTDELKISHTFRRLTVMARAVRRRRPSPGALRGDRRRGRERGQLSRRRGSSGARGLGGWLRGARAAGCEGLEARRATGCRRCLPRHLEQPRGAHAAADAHRDDDVAHAAPPAFDQRVARRAARPTCRRDGRPRSRRRPR